MTESYRSGSRRTFLGALAAAWPAAHLLRAQEQDAKFSTDVKVVNILATVRDKQGHMVSVLGKDDFNVSEDGRPQVIKYFSHETDLPLTLGLLVDTSMSQRRVLGQERSASLRFLDRVLRAQKDKTFIIHFDFETELLQDLTAKRADLEHALDQLELPANGGPQMRRAGGGGGYPGGGGGGRSGGGTTLYDAIYLASNDIMKPLPRDLRKAVILLTDGVDHGSKTFLNDAIEAAQRSDTICYSILFADEQQQQQRPPITFGGMGGGRHGGMGRPPVQRVDSVDGKKILQRISRETGGSFFEVTKKLSIDDIFDKIQEELRNQYNIGYVPDQGASSGYRAIKVTTKQSGMTVQAREGYYPR